MVAVPPDIPVTTPVAAPTVALVRLLLDQLPPESALPRVVVRPTQTVGDPVMADIAALTVTIVEAVQPEASVYVMPAVPVDTLVTRPLDEPTKATDALSLTHVPPVVALLSVPD